MAILKPGQPIASSDPQLVVQNLLPPGVHRFSLEVVDDHGRVSAPDVCVVRVLPHAPNARPTP